MSYSCSLIEESPPLIFSQLRLICWFLETLANQLLPLTNPVAINSAIAMLVTNTEMSTACDLSYHTIATSCQSF